MSQIVIPEGYRSLLTLRQTQIAIKKVKDFFQKNLAVELNLTRVSAPLFVSRESGLNDNLNGVERPVNFDVATGDNLEIVHSLAKWKRMALRDYKFAMHEGLSSLFTSFSVLFICRIPPAVSIVFAKVIIFKNINKVSLIFG